MSVENASSFAITESTQNLLLVFPLQKYGLVEDSKTQKNSLRVQFSPFTQKTCPRQLHFQFFIEDQDSSVNSKRFVFERLLPRDLALPQQFSYFEKQDHLIIVVRKHAPEIWSTPTSTTTDLIKSFVEDPGPTLSTAKSTDNAENAGGEGGIDDDSKKGPLMFIRSDEGDITMGHAVLLTNRLFYELM